MQQMYKENAIYIFTAGKKTCLGKVSKEKVSKKYFIRVKKIWKSKLPTFNKTIAHKIFTVPVLIPTFSILDWAIQKIKGIDIKTRKI